MAETVSPTRMNLLQRRNTLRVAVQGVDLLKRKRDALVADFFKIVREALAARERLTAAAREAYVFLSLAKAVEGKETLEVAATEIKLKKIGEEIKKTTRRVNALEQVVIPRIRGEIRYIAAVLEQRAREDVFRLKRIKKKLEAKERRAAPAAIRPMPADHKI